MGAGVLFDQSRRHAIDGAARRRDLDGEGAGERLDAGLGRGGNGKARQATGKGMGHEGRHADHAAAGTGLDQPRLGRRREFVESRGHRRDAGIPGGTVDLADRPAVGEARIAHHDIEPSKPGHGLVDEALRRAGLAEIALKIQRFGTAGAYLLGDFLGTRAILAGMQHDGGVRRGERSGRGGADAGGRAGDQDDSLDGRHGRISKVPQAQRQGAQRQASRTAGARRSANRRAPWTEKCPLSTKSAPAKEPGDMAT